MAGKETEVYHLKPEEQLRSQVDCVSRRISYPLAPISTNGEAFSLSLDAIKRRFPHRYEVYVGGLRKKDLTSTPKILEVWRRLSPLVVNLNRYIESQQQGERHRVKLKERQFTIFEDVRDRIEDGNTEGTIQAPTGFGKTAIFNQLVSAADVPTLIVAPTKRLVKQTYARFHRFTPEISVGIVYTDKKEYGRQVTITTYSSLVLDSGGRLINPDGIGLVILDESHWITSEKRIMKVEAVEQFKDAIIIGLSATPVEIQDRRLADTRVAKMTKSLWHTVPEREAIEEGYLCQFSSVLVGVDVDLTDIQVTAKGDYNEKELDARINTVMQNKAAVEFFLEVREKDRAMQKAQGKKRIIPLRTSLYASSVAHAKELAQELQEVGVKAAAVWGTSNTREQKEQDEVMKKWERGEIEVVCSKDLLVEGLDIATIRFIMNVAPTASKKIEKQRSGRGLRLDKNDPRKETIIADFVYKNSDKRHQQVTYPQVVGAAMITKFVDDGGSRPGGRTPIDLGDIQIEGLRVVTNAEEVMRISNQMAKQREDSAQIDLDSELAITHRFLKSTFIGGVEKNLPLSRETLAEITKIHTEALRQAASIAREGQEGVEITALRKEFERLYMQMMQEKGAILQKDNPPIDLKFEVAITTDYILNKFMGGKKRISAISSDVLNRIAIEQPGVLRQAPSVNKKGKKGKTISVLLKSFEQLYLQMMQERGVELQEIIDPEHEIVITTDFLKRFIGRRIKLRFVSNEVQAQIALEYPDAVRTIEKGRSPVNNVLKKKFEALFVQLMQEKGVKLR